MSFEEKGAWITGFVAVAGYAVYLVLILGQGRPVPDVDYVVPMLWTIGGAIVTGIIGSVIAGITSPKDKKDQRDRQIYRFGEYTGQAFLVIGGVGALLLAMVQADYFWIANVLYLGFVLSGILSTIAKVVAYRRGLPAW